MTLENSIYNCFGNCIENNSSSYSKYLIEILELTTNFVYIIDDIHLLTKPAIIIFLAY